MFHIFHLILRGISKRWAVDWLHLRPLALLFATSVPALSLSNNALNARVTQACGREAECIQVYKTVEQTHPNKAVKKQAAELRYIMEAPKLQLRPEEKISLPLLENLDRYKYVHTGLQRACRLCTPGVVTLTPSISSVYVLHPNDDGQRMCHSLHC